MNKAFVCSVGVVTLLSVSPAIKAQTPPVTPPPPGQTQTPTLPDQVTKGLATQDVKVSAADIAKVAEGLAQERRKAEEAQRAKNKAEEESTETKQDLQLLKNGSLLTAGLTGGLAFAMQFRLFDGEATQKGVGTTAMPYVLVLPGYLSASQPTREACRSTWAGSDRATATDAALAAARKDAVHVFDGISTALEARSPDPRVPVPDALVVQISKELSLPYDGGPEKAQYVKDLINTVNAYRALQGEQRVERRKMLISWMAYEAYKPTLSARCWYRNIGVWVGYPVNFDARVELPNFDRADGTATATRTARPYLAAGIGFAPSTYITILLGVTLSRVTRDATPASREVDGVMWSTTLGIGGNIDIIADAIKR